MTLTHHALTAEPTIFHNRVPTDGAWSAYGQSKLANILFAKELHDQLEPRGVLCVSLHPGVIKTNLARHMGNWVTSGVGGWLFENLITDKTIPQGASTTLYGCLAPGLKGAFLAPPPPRAPTHALSKPVN